MGKRFFSYKNRPRAKVQDYALPINRVLPDLLTGSFLITVTTHTPEFFNLQSDLDIFTRKQRQRENGSNFKTSSPDVKFCFKCHEIRQSWINIYL